MPNRNGMQTRHDMWPGNEFGGTKKADTANVACMKNCSTEPTVASFLPDFARDAHGNLLEQNRSFGPQRGADTSKPGQVPAPFAGVVTLTVEVGDEVQAGQPVATIEAMKMEAAITAPVAGTIERVAIGHAQAVEGGDLLVVIA